MKIRLHNLRGQPLAIRAAVLVLCVAAAYLLLAVPTWCFAGPQGLVSAAVAGLACLAGSSIALIAVEPFRATHRVLPGVLLGMIFRMGLPLGLALAVPVCAPVLIPKGFFYYLLFFFEITLLVEVLLSLPPKQLATDPALECVKSTHPTHQ